MKTNSCAFQSGVAALVLALAPCGVAAAQSSSSSKIVIGDGAISRGSSVAYTKPDQSAFASAVAAIGGPSSSGTIEVLPGTYTFTSGVDLTEPGIRISGGPNAVIRLAASFTGPLFTVRAPATDCIVDGLTLAFEGDASDAGGRVLVDIVGNGFTLTNCRILVSSASTSPELADSKAILVSGFGGACSGTLIEGNTFLAGRTDDPDGAATHVDAPGWTLLGSVDGRNLRVLGNAFRSGRDDADTTAARLRNAIHLVDDQWSALVGNTFARLESGGAGTGADAALIGSRRSTPGTESNHLVFSGNQIAACPGPSNLCLDGHGYSSITGNVFDRLGTHEQGTVQLLDNVGNSVTGNVFSNLGASVGPSLRCVGGSSLCVQGNSFLLPDDPLVGQTDAQLLIEGVTGALISGNQFASKTVGATQIEFEDAAEGSIVGNAFETPACHAIAFGSLAPQQVFVCSNLFRLPAEGCPGPAWQVNGYTVLQCDVSSGNPGF
jgi:hypothetical protein